MQQDESASSKQDDEQPGHVRFSAEQMNTDHELGIVIRKKGEELQEVHLGFLKLGHHYQIEFSIEDTLGEDIIEGSLPRSHCRMTSYTPTEDGSGHNISVSFHAQRDKLINETLLLKSADNSKTLTLKLVARILGKHKGTPMLKNGIKCVGVDVDDESEQSDWVGF